MKNLKHYSFVLLTLFSIVFSACDDDNNPPVPKFEEGVFVVNEGKFQAANGTISFIDKTNNTVTQDLFGASNNGLALGDVVQSMTIDGDLAYIVVNNSNKMEVVNSTTFVSEYTLTDLGLPRYFTTWGGKGYVTEWVSFSDPGRVSIVDLASHEATGTITTDYGAENIIAVGGKLYVSNNFTNTVSVIDPVAEEVIKTIEVSSAPGAFVVDEDGMLWVICGGGYEVGGAQANDGALVQIDPSKSDDEGAESVQKTIELGVNVTAKAVISSDKTTILYYVGNSVYAVSTTATEPPVAPLLTEAAATDFYGIGIEPDTDILYLSDAKAFAGNGTVFRYTITGTTVDNVVAGIAPNSFVFK